MSDLAPQHAITDSSLFAIGVLNLDYVRLVDNLTGNEKPAPQYAVPAFQEMKFFLIAREFHDHSNDN